MEFRIRKAERVDAHRLAKIHTESWKDAFAEIVSCGELEKQTDFEGVEKLYEKVLREKLARGSLLESDGEEAGFAFWSAVREGGLPDTAELICMHFLGDSRHKGYGSHLMENLLEQMRQEGYKKVVLWVFEENARAIGFYRKWGFTSKGRRKNTRGSTEILYERSL